MGEMGGVFNQSWLQIESCAHTPRLLSGHSALGVYASFLVFLKKCIAYLVVLPHVRLQRVQVVEFDDEFVVPLGLTLQTRIKGEILIWEKWGATYGRNGWVGEKKILKNKIKM